MDRHFVGAGIVVCQDFMINDRVVVTDRIVIGTRVVVGHRVVLGHRVVVRRRRRMIHDGLVISGRIGRCLGVRHELVVGLDRRRLGYREPEHVVPGVHRRVARCGMVDALVGWVHGTLRKPQRVDVWWDDPMVDEVVEVIVQPTVLIRLGVVTLLLGDQGIDLAVLGEVVDVLLVLGA